VGVAPHDPLNLIPLMRAEGGSGFHLTPPSLRRYGVRTLAKINPSDDAIAIAAAQLAGSLVKLRLQSLHSADFAAQEKHLMNYYKWAVDQLVHERNA
jgi:hypothetical protein